MNTTIHFGDQRLSTTQRMKRLRLQDLSDLIDVGKLSNFTRYCTNARRSCIEMNKKPEL